MNRVRSLSAVCLIFCFVSQSESRVDVVANIGPVQDVNDVIRLRCHPGDDCYPSQPDVAELYNKLSGRVILPHMYEYVNQSHMYNTATQRYPRIVVMANSSKDIQEAIMFARKFNLHVTIRSSGHDYVGRSTWDGSININLSEMKGYEVNLDSTRSEHGEIKVQTGLTWVDIYKMLDNEYNRTIVGGSAHTVTPGGYTLVGGHSPISRSLGYAVDNVLEIQVVLADGSIVTCTTDETVIENVDGSSTTKRDGDLFWAMRGGAGGTYGVVVYFVYRLHEMPAGMVTVSAHFPMKIDATGVDLSTQVLTALGNILTSLPREWGGYYFMGNRKIYDQGMNMTGSLQLGMNKFAPWDGSEKNILKEFLDLGKQYNITVTFRNHSSFWEYERHVYDAPVARVYLFETMLQPENVNEKFYQFLQDEFYGIFENAILGCTGIMVGGQTTEFSVKSTPLNPGYRTAISCLSCSVTLGDPLGNQPWFEQSKYDNVLIAIADALSERLREFGNGMYLNEPTKNNPHWKEDFWGDDNYRRLLAIKRRYDPENFFTCHHCVGSDTDGKSTTPGISGATLNMTYYPMLLVIFMLNLLSV